MYNENSNIYEDPLFPTESSEGEKTTDNRNGGYKPSVEEILEECEYIMGLK